MTFVTRALGAAFRSIDVARRSHHLSPSDRWAVPLTQRNLERLLRFRTMLALVRDKPGAVVECGLGVLKTFQVLALLLQTRGKAQTAVGIRLLHGIPRAD